MPSNPYDPFKDFAPVTLAVDSPNVLMVHPSMPAKTVKELIALLQANPGKYAIAQSGLGTTPMLAAELFKLSFNLDATSVPYNGGAPAVQAVLSNQTPIGFATLPPAYPQIASGGIRALAVTSAKRSPALPDVPTMAEAGAEGQESDTMQGVFVAGRNAARHRRASQPRDRQGAAASGRAGQMQGARLRRRRGHAGGVRSLSKKEIDRGTRSSSTPRFRRFSDSVTRQNPCASSTSARPRSR